VAVRAVAVHRDLLAIEVWRVEYRATPDRAVVEHDDRFVDADDVPLAVIEPSRSGPRRDLLHRANAHADHNQAEEREPAQTPW
jgi:hypothetical protein